MERMIETMERDNTFIIKETCTLHSKYKERIDEAVAYGFITIVNCEWHKEQYSPESVTHTYELKPTEEGETYLAYLML